MAGVQNFRSALGGFNRQDVVHYIEYINNKHNAELEQLNTQLQTVRESLAQAKAEGTAELKAQLEEALARAAELEAQLAKKEAEPAAQAASAVQSGDELEAYRRAERAERIARERAAKIYAQANAALAEATVKVEEVSDSMLAMTEQMADRARQARSKLQEAVASMYAICPEEE